MEFKPKAPISVGMYNEGNVRKIVHYILDGKTISFIPSESIKGVMRNIAKLIASSINDPIAYNCNKGKHNCITLNNDREKLLGEIFKNNEQLNELSDKDKDNLDNLVLSLKCPICRLFGSSMLASKLIFSDMEVEEGKIFTYTSTSINRENNIVNENSLFTVEYIMPKRLFIKIIANNITKPENYLLARLLEYISMKGLQIGGLKSRGYGLIELDNDNSRVKVLEFKDPNSEEDVIYNVDTLLLKNNFKEFSIDTYVKYIENVQ